MNIQYYLEQVDFYLWNSFLIYLLLIVGLFLSVRLKFMQFRYLPLSLKYAFGRHDDKAEGDISQFQALMTALAATIGIGSIAGMATAVIGGGFGAVFWMWVMALIGMVTRYAEAILAVKFRVLDKNKNMCGGPMYYLTNGLKSPMLGIFFAVFGMLAAIGGGNLIQAQSIADAAKELFNMPVWLTGLIIAPLVGAIILGGIKNLGRINAVLVPVMAVIYIAGGLMIIIIKIQYLPAGLYNIFVAAFSPKAAYGALAGIGVMNAIQMGIARGISSNEAGLGSSPIAAAAAKTDLPGRQALISMSGVFLASFVVCTITVLVLAVTDVVGQTAEDGQLLNGAPLVMQAFSSVIPGGRIIVAIGLLLFGFSTIIGWAYYGEKCAEYIFKERSIMTYRILFIIVTFLGSMLSLQIVWPIADIFNGLMALPNLLGLLFMSKIVRDESEIFFKVLKAERRRR